MNNLRTSPLSYCRNLPPLFFSWCICSIAYMAYKPPWTTLKLHVTEKLQKLFTSKTICRSDSLAAGGLESSHSRSDSVMVGLAPDAKAEHLRISLRPFDVIASSWLSRDIFVCWHRMLCLTLDRILDVISIVLCAELHVEWRTCWHTSTRNYCWLPAVALYWAHLVSLIWLCYKWTLLC